MNRFDQELSSCDLSGNIFKSIKKGIKSIVKANTKVMSKIAHKVLPKKVREIGKDLDRKGITKMAAGAALMLVAPTLGAKAITSAASKQLIKDGSGKYITVKGKEAAAKHAKEVGEEILAAVKQLPEFKSVVDQMRAEGYTDEQILLHWAESKQFYLNAANAAANTVMPEVENTVKNMGIPSGQVESVSADISSQIGRKVAKDMQNQVTGKSDLKPLVLGAISLLMLAKGG